MFSTLLFVLALSVFTNAGLVYKPRENLSVRIAFEEYNAFWNKTHATAEEKQSRLRNFINAGARIAELSALSTTATFGYTQFADMSPEEFASRMLGFKASTPLDLVEPVNPVTAPGSPIDWVSRGKTTPIKNQEQCGSCWAFSATETVESANLLAGRPMTQGSPQEIVDCDRNDDGCSGGDPREALSWVVQQGGLDTEQCYPYAGVNEQCQSSRCSPSPNLRISSVTPIAGDENSIYQALQSAPLSICCDAQPWQYYSGGILSASACGLSIDHAIQLTGYSPASGGYWIVRNSWGPAWGEAGFIYLQFGQNTCGITSRVTAARV